MSCNAVNNILNATEQASTTRHNIAVEFSRALAEIYPKLQFVRKKLEISDTHEMQMQVIDLYVKIFRFLCHAMRWFSSRWNRFKTSFSDNFNNDQVKVMVFDISKAIESIEKEATQTTETRITDMQSSIPCAINDMKMGIQTDIQDLRLQMTSDEHRRDAPSQITMKFDKIIINLGRLEVNQLGAN